MTNKLAVNATVVTGFKGNTDDQNAALMSPNDKG